MRRFCGGCRCRVETSRLAILAAAEQGAPPLAPSALPPPVRHHERQLQQQEQLVLLYLLLLLVFGCASRLTSLPRTRSERRRPSASRFNGRPGGCGCCCCE
ncbi:unnamed protein product [Lampetra planeri]